MKDKNDNYILAASIIFLIGVILILFFGFGVHKIIIKKYFSTQSETQTVAINEHQHPVQVNDIHINLDDHNLHRM